jgi:hypothetical protein
LTMDSSSSIARSKLSFLTSAWAFSAIVVFLDLVSWTRCLSQRLK